MHEPVEHQPRRERKLLLFSGTFTDASLAKGQHNLMAFQSWQNPGPNKTRIIRREQSHKLDVGHLEDFGQPNISDAPRSQPIETPDTYQEDGEEFLSELDRLKKQVLENAQREAEQLIAVARQRAIKMLEEARKEADQVRDKAHQEGYQQGVEQGLRQTQEQLQEQLGNLEIMVENFQEQVAQQHADALRVLEEHATALSLAVAQRVVMREDTMHQDAVVPLIQQGLRVLADARQITVWVSSADVAFVRQHRDQLMAAFERLDQVHVQVDEQLNPGECLVESDTGLVDATFGERFRLVQQALAEVASINDREAET